MNPILEDVLGILEYVGEEK